VPESSRLSPGDAAPPFSLPTDDGSAVSLSDFPGKRVIVYFYPAALTPGCTKQAGDFQATLGSFRSEGFVVIGISPDKAAKITRFREQDHLTFPLLSDVDHEVMTAYGAFGEKQLYGRTVVGVIRSTFVVDVDTSGHGTISLAQYNVKATGHVAKLRRDLGLD
jgi:thioredoxin-dependent peroxiredoxin